MGRSLSRFAVAALFLGLSACGGNTPVDAPSKSPGAGSSSGQWLPFASFTNGGFESDSIGDSPASWTVTPFLNDNDSNYGSTGLNLVPPSSITDLNLHAGVGDLNTEVVGGVAESQTDPDLGSGASFRFPKYGTRSVRVNKADFNGNNENVNSMEQTMTLDAGDIDPDDGLVHIRFVAAPVLEDPGHDVWEQPYFYIQVDNLTQGKTLYTNFNYSNQPGVPWKDEGGILYTDWQLVDIAPGVDADMGDQIKMRVIASGCSLGGHYGRVYIDAFGSTIPGIYVTGTGPATADADTDITYNLRYKNGGGDTTTNSTIRFETPPNTTFQSISLGGCTTPLMGGTGEISCNVGTLNAGDTATFTLTVHIDPGFNGQIRASDYDISADSVSPLLGPKIDTLVFGAADSISVVSGDDQSTAITTDFASSLVVIVKDSNDNPVPGETVTFTAPGAGASATFAGSLVTDINGKVTITATANSEVGGPYTVSASVVGVVATADFSLTNLPGDPDSISVVSGGTQTAQILEDFADPLVVVVKDALDNPVPGVTVTFTPPGAGATATFAGTFVTDSNGEVSITATAGSVVGGPYTVEADVAGVITTASFSLTNTPGPATSIAVVSGTPQSTQVMTTFGSPLVVVVKDAGNNLLSGINVTFTPPGSGASASVSGLTTTNGSGQVSVTANANIFAGGPYTVSASVAGVVATADFSLTNTPAGAASIAVTGGGTQSTTVNTAFATPLAVIVRDTYGNAVSGVNVTYTVPGAGASAALVTSPATTNGSGAASVTATANTVSGSYSITAAAAGVVPTVSFSMTNTVGAAASIAVVSGSSQSTQVLTVFDDPLVVVVKDAYDNLVSGANVTFTPPGSGASAGLSGTSTTNGSGQVSMTATANGTAGGPYTVSAATSGVVGTADFSLTNTPGAAASISVVAGSSQSTVVNTAFATALDVVVRDAQGNGVPGVPVTFTPPSSGASASLSLTTPLTDSTGHATVTATANTVAGGPYSVNATVGGVGSPATFLLTNTHGAAASLTLVSGGIQTTEVFTAFAAPLVVRALDAYGNVCASESVTWEVPVSGASATPSSSGTTTGSNGETSITVTANGTAGTYPVTARLTGGQQADFTLTNTEEATLTIVAYSGTPQSAEVGTAFGTPLKVLVRTHGVPVPDTIVTFLVPASGPTGTPSSVTAVTDGDGYAEITLTAGQLSGDFEVTASVVGSSEPAVFNLTNDPGAAALITASPISTPQNAKIATAFAVPLIAIVTDTYGNLVPGVDVTFTAPGSPATASLLPGTPVTTDAYGRAEVAATANGTVGTYSITATATGVVGSASFDLGNLATDPVTIAIVSGSPQSTTVGTAFGSSLVAVVEDGNGDPVVGATVTVTPPASGASTGIAGSTTTDGSGEVTFTATANTVAGGYEVIVTTANAASPVRFILANTPDVPALISTLASTTPQSARVTTPFAIPLWVTVTDVYGNPVPGVTVNYAAPGSDPTATLTSSAPTTDAAGMASVIAIASSITGTYNVDATTAGVVTPATFVLTNLQGDPATISVTLGGTQTTLATTDFGDSIVVLVLDAYGNVVEGTTVTVSIPSSGVSASASSTSLTTDSAGLASVEFTANAALGSYVATFSVDGAAAPVTASLTNIAIPTTTTIAIDPEEPTVDAQPTLIATVTSDHGTPIGKVRFVVNGVDIGTAELDEGGVARLATSFTSLGSNDIAAIYDEHAPFGASDAATSTVTVNPDSGILDGGGCGQVSGNGGSLFILLSSVLLGLLVGRRKRKGIVPVALALMTILSAVTKAQAQSAPGAAINTYHPSPAGSEWFALDSLNLRGNLRPTVRAVLDYAYRPLIVYNQNTSQRFVVVDDQLWMHLGFGITLMDRMRLGLSVPIAMYQDYNLVSFNSVIVNPNTKAGFGDIEAYGDYRFFGKEGDPLMLAGGVTINFPTGSQEDLLSDGKIGAAPRVSVAGDIGRYTYAGQVAVAFRTGQIANVEFNREFRFGGAVGARFLDKKMLLGPEMYGLVDLGSSPGKDRSLGLEAILGIHYWASPSWNLGIGAGGGIVRSAGVPDVRVLASISWTPGEKAKECVQEKVICPADRDGDGVLDSADQCPDVHLGPHPDPNRMGCPMPPQEPPPPPAPTLTKVDRGKILIVKPVLFATDKDIIREVSYPVLQSVADTLNQEPGIERVSIEGHTDSKGNPTHNLDLSQRRAKSVMKWLIDHGIAADRLESHGYGPSRPIADNNTEEGRMTNRRVEFNILKQK